jgi:preprotein translocase subunit SecA
MHVRIQSPEEAAAAAAETIARNEELAHAGHGLHADYSEDGVVEAEVGDGARPAAAAQEVPRVGRNDPCPCGSGLKYKNCHGKLV